MVECGGRSLIRGLQQRYGNRQNSMEALLDKTFGIITVVAVFGCFIFVHELGHFLACKKVGVRVEVFSLGFGPYIFSFRRGETLYALSVIPLGGYIKMAGEDAMGRATSATRSYEYGAKTPFQRAQIAVAGVLMNAVMGYLVYVLAFTWGVKSVPPTAYYVEPGGAADKAGIPKGSEVVSVDGSRVFFYQDMILKLVASGTDKTTLGIRTPSNETKEVTVDVEERGPFPYVGFEPKLPLRIGADIDTTVTIGDVQPDTPAEKAGLKKGDLVVSFDGEAVGNIEDLAPMVHKAGGSKKQMVVRRGDEDLTIEIEPVILPGEQLPRLGIALAQQQRIASVPQGSVAEKAGLSPGDIIEIPRKGIRENPSAPPPGEITVTLEVSRAGRTFETEITPRFGDDSGDVLLHYQPRKMIRVPFLYSLRQALLRSRWAATAIVRFLEELRIKDFSGPITVFVVTYEARRFGFGMLLDIVGFISINLAVINLFPMPPLDGGNLVLLGYEAVRRKQPPRLLQEILQTIGIVLILALLVFVTIKDIVSFI